jgi:hypothetical protein
MRYKKTEHRRWIALRRREYEILLKTKGILKPDENLKWNRDDDVYIASVIRDGIIIELARFYGWGK